MPVMSSSKLRSPSVELVRTLSDNLRRLRGEHKLSQEALAERCGLHRTYIGSIERGERNATLSSLEAIAMSLDVPVASLLSNDTEVNSGERG